MAQDISTITALHRDGAQYTTYSGITVYGLDATNGTYRSAEIIGGKLVDFLKNMRDSNKYNIQIANMKRKGDRNYTARYYQIPYKNIMETWNYGDAREMGLANQNFSIYRQEGGQGCLVVNAGACAVVERLYVIKHEIADGSIPFYYDKKGNPCSQLSFNYDMFFSASKQALDKQTHIYDGCTHIETIFVDPRFDPKNLCD